MQAKFPRNSLAIKDAYTITVNGITYKKSFRYLFSRW